MNNEYWLHYAHLLDLEVREGDRVKKGQVIGHVGDSGSPGHSHLHFEIQSRLRKTRETYTKHMTSTQIADVYINPYQYFKEKDVHHPLPEGKVTGYDWLDKVSNNKLHPGIDLNIGSGYDDYGQAIYACEDGIIDYIGKNKPGWGNHIFIKINSNNLMTKEAEELKEYINDKFAEFAKTYDAKISQLKSRKKGKSWINKKLTKYKKKSKK